MPDLIDAATIQAVFLDPIAEDIGKPFPANRAHRIARRMKRPLAAEIIRAAGERLLRTHKGDGLPAMPACLAALNAATERTAPARGGVTAKNYADRAAAFCRARDEWPVIERHRDTQAWADWRAYFARLGYVASVQAMAEASKWGVPSAFPAEFDPSATGLVVADLAEPTPEERQRMAARFAELKVGLGPAVNRWEREQREQRAAEDRVTFPIGWEGARLSEAALAKAGRRLPDLGEGDGWGDSQGPPPVSQQDQ